MIRRSARAAALAAVAFTAVGAAVALVGAPAGAATSSHIQRGVDAAAAYARYEGMTVGVAVRDTRTGQVWVAGSASRRFATASVVKTMIATRLLLSGQMRGTVAKQAWVMITRSDNRAAWALYPKVGRDRLLPWLERHYALSGIGAPPTMPGIWGSTQVTARGLVRFYDAVRADPKVWPWLGKAMHAYARTSSTGEPNAFGLAQAAPKSAVKNGWDTDRDVQHPTNAIINTTGVALGDRYAVAILTEGPGRLYYAAGERIVSAAALRVVRGLTGGTIPALPRPRTVVLSSTA